MYTANGSGLVQHLKLGNDGATTISGNVIIPTLNTGAAIGTVDYGGDAKAHANAFYTASGGGEFALAIRNDNQAGNGLFIRFQGADESSSAAVDDEWEIEVRGSRAESSVISGVGNIRMTRR